MQDLEAAGAGFFALELLVRTRSTRGAAIAAPHLGGFLVVRVPGVELAYVVDHRKDLFGWCRKPARRNTALANPTRPA